jgi:hypothetical protein
MERPQSIITFERCYLGAVALGLASNALNWTNMQEQMAATPNSQLLPDWFLPATIGVGIVITLLLWYFVARRASAVAKWILVFFFALGLLGLPGMITGVTTGLIAPLMAIVALATLGLNAFAVWMLFQPDAKLWFASQPTTLTDTFS